MDVTAIRGGMQTASPRANRGNGPVIDLTGERGVTVVTAYDADLGGDGCRVSDPAAPAADGALVGSWVIADPAIPSAAGGDAIGLTSETLPSPAGLSAGLAITTYDPTTLTSSEVILIGVEAGAGSGPFRDAEPGPITAPMESGSHVCCDVRFVDNLETQVSLPDVCFDCVGFHPIAAQHRRAADDAPLVPATVPIGSSGTVYLTHCRTASADGLAAPLGRDRPQFLFAFHLQTVGRFGTTSIGAYAH
jgi:hypothetical protein